MGPSPDHYYSAPEVVPDTRPHVSRDSTLPEAVDYPGKHYPEVHYPQHPVLPKPYQEVVEPQKAREPENDLPEVVDSRSGPKKRICGLVSRTFWILFAVTAVVIVAAAVGVGVGVGVSISNRSQSAESSSASPTSSSNATPTSLGVVSTSGSVSSSPSDAPTTTSAQTISVTTTNVVGPSSTLFRDCPSSDETLHEVTFGNDTYMFRKYCSTVLASTGADNVVSSSQTNLNSCINECARYNFQKSSEIASGATNKCNTVCWWNNFGTQYPGQCWGFETQNSTAGEFQFETQLICDSAAWINEP